MHIVVSNTCGTVRYGAVQSGVQCSRTAATTAYIGKAEGKQKYD